MRLNWEDSKTAKRTARHLTEKERIHHVLHQLAWLRVNALLSTSNNECHTTMSVVVYYAKKPEMKSIHLNIYCIYIYIYIFFFFFLYRVWGGEV